MADEVELGGSQNLLNPKNPFIFGRGKYAGDRITEMPDSYLLWITQAMDEGSVWHTEAEKELKRRRYTGDYIGDEEPDWEERYRRRRY